jgi:VanZ family protein
MPGEAVWHDVEEVVLKIFFLRWFPLIAWVAVIFGLSSIPGITLDGPELPGGIDKVAHFFEYAILAFVLHRGLSYRNERGGLLMIIVVVSCGLAIAVLDELYQSLIPGRESSVADIISDIAGIAAGTVAALIRKRMIAA